VETVVCLQLCTFFAEIFQQHLNTWGKGLPLACRLLFLGLPRTAALHQPKGGGHLILRYFVFETLLHLRHRYLDMKEREDKPIVIMDSLSTENMPA
jgi:hypothetical protein